MEAGLRTPTASIAWTELVAALAGERVVREYIRDAARLRYLPLSVLAPEDFATAICVSRVRSPSPPAELA